MEKKSLGRGLEDIADIFISQKKENTPRDDASIKNVKDVVGGYYPANAFEGSKPSNSLPEEDIRPLTDERFNVPMDHLNSEQFFEHDYPGRGDSPRSSQMEVTPEDHEDVCEITEHITSTKKMAYLNTADVQKNIIKSLSQHLRQNYNIKNIELVKVNEVSRPGMKNIVQENILIYIKEQEDP